MVKSQFGPGPPLIWRRTGVLISQLPFSKTRSSPTLEKPMMAALLLFQSGLAALGQLLNIGSSAAPFLGAIGMFAALSVDAILVRNRRAPGVKHRFRENGSDKATEKLAFDATAQSDVSLWTYAIAMVIPLTTGAQLLSATLVVFVPLVWVSSLHGPSACLTRGS